MATFYEALDSFQDIYTNALSNLSKRELDAIDQNWQTINNEFNLYYNAVTAGDTTSADAHLENIKVILEAETGLTIDEPIQFPLATSVYAAPATITVPVDEDGGSPVYTNAISTVYVYVGGIDDSTNWTYAINVETDVTAVIQNDNEVKINALTADTGSVSITMSKTGYEDLNFIVYVYRYYDAKAGVNISAGPDNIIIPTDSEGNNPDFTNAYTDFTAFVGSVDDTTNWTFAIQSETGVTGGIVDNTYTVTAITVDSATATIRATQTGFSDYDIVVPVKKIANGSSVNISASPGNISVPTDSAGLNPVFTNAFTDFTVFEGGSDETSNWSFAIQSETNMTGGISTSTYTLTAIAADTATATIRATRSGYSDYDIAITAKKVKDGAATNVVTYNDGTNFNTSYVFGDDILTNGGTLSSDDNTVIGRTSSTQVLTNSDENVVIATGAIQFLTNTTTIPIANNNIVLSTDSLTTPIRPETLSESIDRSIIISTGRSLNYSVSESTDGLKHVDRALSLGYGASNRISYSTSIGFGIDSGSTGIRSIDELALYFSRIAGENNGAGSVLLTDTLNLSSGMYKYEVDLYGADGANGFRGSATGFYKRRSTITILNGSVIISEVADSSESYNSGNLNTSSHAFSVVSNNLRITVTSTGTGWNSWIAICKIHVLV
jgi:hypothetical protein